MFQIGETDFISQTRFWRLIIQHHRITSTDLALPPLSVAELSNPSALKPQECMGDVLMICQLNDGVKQSFSSQDLSGFVHLIFRM